VVLSSIPGDDMPAGPWWRADKVIHAFVYAGLAVLVVRAFLRGPPRLTATVAVMAAVALAVAFGASDEWHQSFVPGRTSSAMDLAADGLGACMGAIAAVLYYRRGRRFRG